ncbi:MAG: hypothetical protein V1743_01325 [Nanoarchaeota archaeon]
MARYMANLLLTILTFLFVFLTISLNIFLFLQTRDVMTGKATENVGRMSFCINAPPVMSFNCSPNMTQNTPYACVVTGNDSDNDSFVFRSNFTTNRTVFNITAGGVISLTPIQDDVGNHTANISIDDLKCNDGGVGRLFNFEVANVNDRPVLRTPLPDETLLKEIQLQAFFLNDYFYDPDSDALTFTSTLTSYFTISIAGDSMVVITPLTCPAEEYIIFTATDILNQSADSNAVLLKCVLPLTPSQPGTGTGSGAGGGAGSSTTCKTKMDCLDWEPCEKDNTQRRKCFDRMGCKEGILFMFRECDYIAQCHNGILDSNEEDVDCGGPCPVCPSCTDGVRNGNEVNIDCGGSCEPCIISNILFAEDRSSIVQQNDTSNLSAQARTDRESQSQSLSWNLSVWNTVTKQAALIDTASYSLPFGEFTMNASQAYYVKSQDIWRVDLTYLTSMENENESVLKAAQNATNTSQFNASRITAKVFPLVTQETSNESAFSVSVGQQGIYYAKMRDMANASASVPADAANLLLYQEFGQNQSEEIPVQFPVFSLDALPNGRMIAFSIANFTLDFSRKYYIKRLESYIFGNVLLGERSKIFIVDKNGEVLFTFEDPDLSLYAPKFSSDGTMLVYFTSDGRQSDLWMVSLNDSTRLQLTNSPNSNELFPLFSRDKKHILYSANYNGIYALYSLEFNATDLTMLNSSMVTRKILSSSNNLIAFDWYVSPTCFDGLLNQDEKGVDCGGMCGPCGSCQDRINNQNEVGVDCGGVCPPCAEIQAPLFAQARGLLFYLAFIFPIFLILLLLTLAYRKQLRNFSKHIQESLATMKKKAILLDPKAKEHLLKSISQLEGDLATMPLKDVALKFISISRDYYIRAFGMNKEFFYKELYDHITARKHRKLLKDILTSYAKEINKIEFGDVSIRHSSIRKLMEELRLIILFTSKHDVNDAWREYQEKEIDKSRPTLEQAYELISNILVVLQFEEVSIAKSKYADLLTLYYGLPNEEQVRVYEDVKRLYDLITLKETTLD